MPAMTMGGDKRRVITAVNQVGAQAGDRVMHGHAPQGGFGGQLFGVHGAGGFALLAGAAWWARKWGPSWGLEPQTGAVVLGALALLGGLADFAQAFPSAWPGARN